ncbi:membrane-bound PQQ-dependent dehydrogenase, glucose/quinate/shikimate family [Sphingomonas sp. AP4-R1]|uniref:membrane-bound PQQ-dependent dehydrogenase, glucose/quinate/shikimate family n=1 Tax=Sphingomonas sp. AP4-R1 TaxID=2735134 RepID=UPI00149343FC|nr:membrane-bound PQQ-dependent dehydrogenase, glucose/quinate/shikimate family [Sphingomonas sp. AP4-R1]QJU59233.1 membrane-bound PQQ-dependent dehydrogenase, glucose/quinate/shikimate family [Sphingomonas sp. AP4-R1]
MRVAQIILGWSIAVLGGYFAVAGGVLAALGGSLYYVITGVAMVGSGALIGRGDSRGRALFVAIWIGTVLWALWEVGTDGLQLIPRVVAPTVLLLLVLIFAGNRRSSRRGARFAPAAAVGIAVLLGGGMLFRDHSLVAQPAAAPIPAPPAADTDGDWQDYGGTLAGRRYSALTDITPANVGKLQLAWTQRTGDLPDPAEATEHKREYHSESTPIHIGDTLYTCTPHSVVQAIDATTGKTRWSWRETASREGQAYLVCRGVAYYEAPAGTPCPHRIFASTFNARLVALDADTGRICPSFGTNGAIDLRANMGVSRAADQIGTSPPVVANGRLILGERITDNVNRDIPSGVVRAYDPVSGTPIWAWDVGRSQDAIAPLPPGQTYTRGTPNVWGAITADPANGLVYLGTGNASPDYYIGLRRPFDDRFGTAIVALEIATGKLRWMRQLVHRDMWDMDLPIGPSLFDYHVDGRTIPALIQTTKMGQVYFLNRLTGAPLAAIEERRVRTDGATPGLRVSPTQPFSVGMPSMTPPAPTEVATWGATPIDQLMCRIDIRRAQGTGIYQPMGLKPIIGHPAFDGVTDWGGAAIDPVRGIMTVNTMEMPFKLYLMPRGDPREAALMKQKQGGENAKQAQLQTQYNTPYTAVVKAWVGIFGAPCVAPPWGHITAIDLKTRKVLWRETLGTARDTGLFGSHLGLPLKTGVPNLGGSIITAGGLAFIGATTDQYLRAFDLHTGRIVWKARLPAGAQATPMTYRGADGRQYVVITAGGHGALGTRYGDYTLAFALPRSS